MSNPPALYDVEWFHKDEGPPLHEFEVAVHDATRLDPEAPADEVIVTLVSRSGDPAVVACARTTRAEANQVRDQILTSLNLKPGCYITLSGTVPVDPATVKRLQAAGHTVIDADFFPPWERSRSFAREAVANWLPR